MTRILLLSLCLLMALPSFGQRKKKRERNQQEQPVQTLQQQMPDSINRQVFQMALDNADYQTAITSLYYIMAQDPEGSYLDSLASLYFIKGDYVQAVVVGRKFIEDNPVDTGILELVASSEQEIGRFKEALELYEKLETLTGSPFYSYQKAVLQYRLQRVGEMMATLNQIVQSPMAPEETVQISAGQGAPAQDVPVQAAAYNLMGISYVELKQPEQAKAAFQKAIEAFPEFSLAQQNLQQLLQRQQQGQPQPQR